jgi:hypothetical protein
MKNKAFTYKTLTLFASNEASSLKLEKNEKRLLEEAWNYVVFTNAVPVKYRKFLMSFYERHKLWSRITSLNV